MYHGYSETMSVYIYPRKRQARASCIGAYLGNLKRPHQTPPQVVVFMGNSTETQIIGNSTKILIIGNSTKILIIGNSTKIQIILNYPVNLEQIEMFIVASFGASDSQRGMQKKPSLG